jgi:glycosyltransferase involved in cell wall biosynthesis
MRRLKILHVMRAPVGGLFRHVVDLARGQADRGHAVGILADATTGSDQAEAVLADLAPALALGVARVPMSRHLGPRDVAAWRAVRALARRHAADVLHGHGAKGGAYARLMPRGEAVRVYTPHGGSLHYSRRSPLGMIYLTLEQALMARTELFLFESDYGRQAFNERIGTPQSPALVVHNGVGEAEFAPVTPEPDRTDLLFVGELRLLKGVDILLAAIALLKSQGVKATASIVGDGPDAARFRAQVAELGLGGHVQFAGPLPARTAFAKGRILVVPSRAESLPYIVLEAAAARMPIIASAVGGIPEIFGPDAPALIQPGDPAVLTRAVGQALADPELILNLSKRLQERVRASFSIDTMVKQVLSGYAQVLVSG